MQQCSHRLPPTTPLLVPALQRLSISLLLTLTRFLFQLLTSTHQQGYSLLWLHPLGKVPTQDPTQLLTQDMLVNHISSLHTLPISMLPTIKHTHLTPHQAQHQQVTQAILTTQVTRATQECSHRHLHQAIRVNRATQVCRYTRDTQATQGSSALRHMQVTQDIQGTQFPFRHLLLHLLVRAARLQPLCLKGCQPQSCSNLSQ